MVLRSVILAAARLPLMQTAVAAAPLTRGVVRRFVAGTDPESGVGAARRLTGAGLAVSLDHLGEDTRDGLQARAAAQAYQVLLGQLAEAGLTAGGQVEVSVKPSALGQAVDAALALDLAGQVCAAAAEAGTTVTVDMEGSATTEATLGLVGQLRRDFPQTGAVVQAYLRRTEGDCRDLAVAGSRVRLCKGAYQEPRSVAFQEPAEVEASYERCLRVLMAGPGYPMVATHDPRLVALAGELAARRPPGSFEYQMLYGVRPAEQERLAATGVTVRVYVPYGDQWYGYLMRRLAERPANLAFFLRALRGRS